MATHAFLPDLGLVGGWMGLVEGMKIWLDGQAHLSSLIYASGFTNSRRHSFLRWVDGMGLFWVYFGVAEELLACVLH
jgi:hypothetical protein